MLVQVQVGDDSGGVLLEAAGPLGLLGLLIVLGLVPVGAPVSSVYGVDVLIPPLPSDVTGAAQLSLSSLVASLRPS